MYDEVFSFVFGIFLGGLLVFIAGCFVLDAYSDDYGDGYCTANGGKYVDVANGDSFCNVNGKVVKLP